MSALGVPRRIDSRVKILSPGVSSAPKLAVSFTIDQAEWLKHQASRRKISVAEMVRRCIQVQLPKVKEI